jgi:hypothetical protein
MPRRRSQSLEELRRIVQNHPSMTDAGCNHMPSPEEIAAECLRIRATWTPAEERWHRARKNPPATIPGV